MKPLPSLGLTELAYFLCEQRDLIMQRWRDAARGNIDIQSTDHLSTAELSNHLPDLLGDLAHTLRTGGPDSTRAEARQNARVHGCYRWQQDYRMDEVLRELNIVRRIVLRQVVAAFFKEHAEAGEAEIDHAYDLVERFFEDTAIGSVEQFFSEQQERLRAANGKLQVASRALEAANEKLKQADAARLGLIRNVSHDLRNILNGLSAAVSVLGEEVDESERYHVLMVCHRNFADMSALLKELLDYSVLLTNPRREVESFSAALLLDELATTFRPMAQARGLVFDASIYPKLKTVATDRGKLKQIVTNLLTNAIKYRKRDPEDGGESGKVSLSFLTVDDARWKLVVEDAGIGIAPEDCTRIFEEFQRVTPREHVQGTGLGLAIVKRLVGLLEGSVEVRSQLGHGSRFEVTLPLTIQSEVIRAEQ